MVEPDREGHRMTEIRRRLGDLMAMAERLARSDVSGSATSPGAARLYDELSRLAAAVQERAVGRESLVEEPLMREQSSPSVPQQPSASRAEEPAVVTETGFAHAVGWAGRGRHGRGGFSGPCPSATDYWFG